MRSTAPKRKVPTRTFQIELSEWRDFADTAKGLGRTRSGQLRHWIVEANRARKARNAEVS